jgi:O-antigen/teichoic acid export membrane protein
MNGNQAIEEGTTAASVPEPPNALESAKARIPRNVLCNLCAYGVNLVVGLIIAPLVVHGLGTSAYGVWALIGDMIGYSTLLDLGIRIAVSRYISWHHARGQTREINSILTTGLAFAFVSATILLAGGVVLAMNLTHFFAIPPDLVHSARIAVLLVAAGVAISFPGSLFTGCVTAVSRYDLLSIRNSAWVVCRAVLLWIVLRHGGGIVAVASASLVVACFGYLLDLIFARRILRNLSLGRQYFDLGTLKILVHFSIYAFILSISWRLLFMTDTLVVGFVLGPAVVTFYAVVTGLTTVLRDSLGTVATLYSPLASQMDALGQRKSLQRLFLVGSRVGFAYVVTGVVALVILGPHFLGLWMGPAFILRSGPILRLLAIEVSFYALSFTCGQVLYGMNKHRVNAWVSLSNAAVNFTLSTILIRHWGPVGVAWGTVIPAFVVEVLVLPLYTARLVRVSPVRFYVSSVLKPIAAAAPYALWLWFALSHAMVGGYISLAVVAAAGVALYAAMLWIIGLGNEEKELLSRWLRGLITWGRLGLASLEPS